MTGDGVIRDLNTVFGHGNWSTELTREKEIMSTLNSEGCWNVGYLATVKLTLLSTGASHEDVGSGEATNENKLLAHDLAMKSAVTDAMKRSARHFGERLGNALYRSGASLSLAPQDNKTALLRVEWSHGLEFGNQSELRDRKDKGLPFPLKPGNHQAMVQTASKHANQLSEQPSVTPTTNNFVPLTVEQQQKQEVMDSKHQQSPYKAAPNRVSLELGADQCEIALTNKQPPTPLGFVRASSAIITPQTRQQSGLIPLPLSQYVPETFSSPMNNDLKRNHERAELSTPATNKRLCNPYR